MLKSFKPKFPHWEQGFTLVEVLVAIVITTVFIGVAMQVVAIAALLKAHAQYYTEATNWIQQDLEQVKYDAANFEYTSLAQDANSTDTVLKVASVYGFQIGDTLSVGTDYSDHRIIQIDNTTNPPTITLQNAINANWLKGTVVKGINKCKTSVTTAKATMGSAVINVASVDSFAVNDLVKIGSNSGIYTISSIDISNGKLNIIPNLGTEQLAGSVVVGTNSNTGFAESLRTQITNNGSYVSIPEKSSRTGQQFILKRTTAVSSNPPYNILQINYDVLPNDGSKSVASLLTEVIPNAALQCPP